MTDFDIDLLLFGPKFCPTCGQEKAANREQFDRDRCEPDGLSRSCRACRRERDRHRKSRRRKAVV